MIGKSLVAALGLAFVPTLSVACSCFTIGEGPISPLGYAAVFSGDALSLTLREIPVEGGTPGSYYRRIQVRFRVWESWLPLEDSFVILDTGYGGPDCGFNFEIGERYVVFAQESEDGGLSASICSPTLIESQSSEVRKDLGQPLASFKHVIPEPSQK